MLVDKSPHHDTWLCRDAEPDEALTEAERAAEFSEFYYLRLDAELDHFERVR